MNSVQPSYLLITKLVVVNRRGRILTMRRSKGAPRRPWTWDFPGGVVEYGEQPLESTLREAAEEAGLEFNANEVKIIGVYSHSRSEEQAAIVFYRAKYNDADVVLSYEHDEYRWVTKEEFQSLETPDLFKEVASSI